MSQWFGAFTQQLNLYQKSLNSEIALAFRGLDEHGIYGALIIIGVSFIYGIVHAVGPGHGKAVVASYFLSHGKRRKEAFKIGYLVAIFHAFSAFLLTFGIYFFIDGIFSRTFNQSVEVLYRISASMILAVGAYLVYEFLKDFKKEESKASQTKKKSYVLALSIGIVPCPGVMTILLFSLTLGHLLVGILAAIAMSIGMGLTISLAGIASSEGSFLLKKSGRLFQIGLQVFSILLIFAIGFFLLFIS
ncbi:MAG: hypothetical protein GX780_03625 [Campylobacteraceae bacterium]|nr:hypothetical protein [Campylobacteraceae bacterium]